jgi:Polymerase beta, Nucleotidyltransferase
MEEQLERLLGAVREVLGDDVVGAYLHGSALLGGLRPRSDLDLLVVARRRMALEEKRSLVERLLAVSRPMPPVRRASSARRTPQRTGHSPACPTSSAQYSHVPERSTSTRRTSAGTTSRRA